MKQTSYSKLSEVYNTINMYTDEEHKNISRLIEDIFRAETPQVKGTKFDFYKYVATDEIREVMEGVFYDSGNVIACDAMILIAFAGEYPPELEGKIVKKDGSFVDGHYPKWREVIPDVAKDYTAYSIDAQRFYDWIAVRRAEWKAECGKGTKFYHRWIVEVGPARLKASYFDLLLTAMKELGTTTIYVQDARRPVEAKTDKGVAILMPAIGETEDDKILKLA